MNSKINGGGSDFVSGKLHSQAHDVDGSGAMVLSRFVQKGAILKRAECSNREETDTKMQGAIYYS